MAPPGPVTMLVGGVGELYQGDLDLGRIAVERLAGERLGPGVCVEELHYGAVAVAQRLQDLRPVSLLLLGAVRRGRAPGSVERRRLRGAPIPAARAQAAVADAVTGYVGIDLVVEVATALRALPSRTVTIEVEPASTEPAVRLSPLAEEGLRRALAMVRTEVRRNPLFELAERLRVLVDDDRLAPAPALTAMRDLLTELARVDEHGRWGATFALRELLRQHIAEGRTGEGMDHRDWALWWALIEELDRLRAAEVAP